MVPVTSVPLCANICVCFIALYLPKIESSKSMPVHGCTGFEPKLPPRETIVWSICRAFIRAFAGVLQHQMLLGADARYAVMHQLW